MTIFDRYLIGGNVKDRLSIGVLIQAVPLSRSLYFLGLSTRYQKGNKYPEVSNSYSISLTLFNVFITITLYL